MAMQSFYVFIGKKVFDFKKEHCSIGSKKLRNIYCKIRFQNFLSFFLFKLGCKNMPNQLCLALLDTSLRNLCIMTLEEAQ